MSSSNINNINKSKNMYSDNTDTSNSLQYEGGIKMDETNDYDTTTGDMGQYYERSNFMEDMMPSILDQLQDIYKEHMSLMESNQEEINRLNSENTIQEQLIIDLKIKIEELESEMDSFKREYYEGANASNSHMRKIIQENENILKNIIKEKESEINTLKQKIEKLENKKSFWEKIKIH